MTEPDKPLDQMTAQERLDLGRSYYNEDKFDEAIKALSSIRREEAAPEIYARALLGIGAAYQALGKLKKAIKAWSKVRHGDDPKAYAGAQFNLGITYKNQDRLGEAITALSSINHEDDRKTYAKAQRNLGVVYHTLGKLDEAIDAWSNVPQDDRKAYAWAQNNLGVTYNIQGEQAQAIKTWSNITRDDDPKTYAKAQFNLGVTYHAQNKLDQAIKTWSNIHHDDDPETYAQAQLSLGGIYEGKREIEQAKEAYRNARGFLYYEGERGYRILECSQEVIQELRGLAENTDKVLKSLQIISEFESRVAHYSRSSTAFTLFGDEKNDKNPSNFRLSTIRGVNDPTEGLVLGKYWDQQGIPETIHANDTATFISCFTFNHDSLNQFRLYGKEDGREATGVSLVFNKKFFSDQSDALEFIAAPSTDPSSKSEQIKPNETRKTESDNKKPLIGKSTLYRCIYLDPETGYWTLAQRDKSTFYREHDEDEDTDAKEKWGDYYKLISEIEGCVETRLFNEENNEEEGVETHLLNKENNDNNPAGNENNKIKSISQILNLIFTEENNLYNKYDKDEKQKILEAIRFILLPLQYLVKHIAFQEEQECRIMYITQFRDEKIHSDREKQWMYVEYEEPVLPHIDKIYLSPGAVKDQDFFRILLDKEEENNKNKVRISQNPFRNKE